MRLPVELVRIVCDYADLRCYLCNERLYPWAMMGYGDGMLLCLEECYVNMG